MGTLSAAHIHALEEQWAERERREHFRTAQIAAATMNAMGGKKDGSPFSIYDFMPDTRSEEEKLEAHIANLKQFAGMKPTEE